MSDKNYYEILEVTPNATMEEIHNAHLRAKNTYSLDNLALYSVMTADECARTLEIIEEAYSILGDQVKRDRYNQARGIKTQDPQFAQTNIMPAQLTQAQTLRDTHMSVTRSAMSKKFELDYKVDTQFEEIIEKTTDFSGEFLKKIREYKNVDLYRLSELTKVSKTYLDKIEKEDFSSLPAPVYVRGFIYQYAKILKLNPELVCSSFVKKLQDAQVK